MKVVADIALYSGGTHEVDPLHETKRFLDDQEMIYNCHALGLEVESTVEQLMVILEKLHEHLHSKSPRLTSAVKILYQADGEASIKNCVSRIMGEANPELPTLKVPESTQETGEK